MESGRAVHCCSLSSLSSQMVGNTCLPKAVLWILTRARMTYLGHIIFMNSQAPPPYLLKTIRRKYNCNANCEKILSHFVSGEDMRTCNVFFFSPLADKGCSSLQPLAEFAVFARFRKGEASSGRYLEDLWAEAEALPEGEMVKSDTRKNALPLPELLVAPI